MATKLEWQIIASLVRLRLINYFDDRMWSVMGWIVRCKREARGIPKAYFLK